MKNTLGDLNNHLFAALERLGDEDIKGPELEEEIRRSDAITDVAEQIISNANIVLKAMTVKSDLLSADAELPKMLEAKDGK